MKSTRRCLGADAESVVSSQNGLGRGNTAGLQGKHSTVFIVQYKHGYWHVLAVHSVHEEHVEDLLAVDVASFTKIKTFLFRGPG
jgi:hypothetical protein